MTKIPMYVALKLAAEGWPIKDFIEMVQPVSSDQSVVSKLADMYASGPSGNLVVSRIVARMVAEKEYIDWMAE